MSTGNRFIPAPSFNTNPRRAPPPPAQPIFLQDQSEDDPGDAESSQNVEEQSNSVGSGRVGSNASRRNNSTTSTVASATTTSSPSPTAPSAALANGASVGDGATVQQPSLSLVITLGGCGLLLLVLMTVFMTYFARRKKVTPVDEKKMLPVAGAPAAGAAAGGSNVNGGDVHREEAATTTNETPAAVATNASERAVGTPTATASPQMYSPNLYYQPGVVGDLRNRTVGPELREAPVVPWPPPMMSYTPMMIPAPPPARIVDPRQSIVFATPPIPVATPSQEQSQQPQ